VPIGIAKGTDSVAKPSVYIETSILSYLVARPTANLLSAACQQVTSEWWDGKRHLYDLFTSELVIAEAKAGHADAAARRLELLRGVLELTISDDVKRLAVAFIAQGALPDKAQAEAIHIAVAAVHNVDYLLTWNCRHIDNPATKPAVRAVCMSEGYRCPEICTPIEIMQAIR
jgi:predicted nucleic acid-binding protein